MVKSVATWLSEDVWLKRANEFLFKGRSKPEKKSRLLSLLRCSNCKRTKYNIQLTCQHVHQMFPLSKLDESQFSLICAIKLISSQMETFSCLGDDLILKTIVGLLTYAYFMKLKILRFFSCVFIYILTDATAANNTGGNYRV